jgi:hypothetical protein
MPRDKFLLLIPLFLLRNLVVPIPFLTVVKLNKEEGRRKKEEGGRKKEEGRRKEGGRKKEEGRRRKEGRKKGRNGF